MEDPTKKLYDHKGWFWDHINKSIEDKKVLSTCGNTCGI